MEKETELDESARVVSRYIHIIAKHGTDSVEALRFYEDNKHNPQFVKYVDGFKKMADDFGDALDDIRENGI